MVIPCHGGAELTALCVRSLLAQQGDHELEILLVDNASPDDTAGLSALDPRVRVLPQPRNLGFAGGVNRGLAAAAHPFLLVLNNDTQAATNLLDCLQRALQQDPRIGLAAPVSNHVKGNARLPLGAAGATAAGRAEIAAALAADCGGMLQDEATLSGLCLLLPRAVWQRLGAFDERFGLGNFEDDDYCLRARLLGYRLVLARDAFLHHEGHRTFRALGLDYAAQLRERQQQFAAKWRQDPAGAAWLADLGGDLAAAAVLAEQALRQHPDWPDAHWILARHCRAASRPDAAIAHLREFLRRCPNHAEALLLLALLLVQQGRSAAAAAVLRHAQRHCQPSEAQVARLLRQFGEAARAAGRPQTALRHFAAAAQLQPDDGELHNWHGIGLLDCGDVAAAGAAFQRALARGCTAAHTNLGICHFRAGDADRARQQFEAAVVLQPHDPAARHNLEQLRQRAPQPAG